MLHAHNRAANASRIRCAPQDRHAGTRDRCSRPAGNLRPLPGPPASVVGSQLGCQIASAYSGIFELNREYTAV